MRPRPAQRTEQEHLVASVLQLLLDRHQPVSLAAPGLPGGLQCPQLCPQAGHLGLRGLQPRLAGCQRLPCLFRLASGSAGVGPQSVLMLAQQIVGSGTTMRCQTCIEIQQAKAPHHDSVFQDGDQAS